MADPELSGGGIKSENSVTGKKKEKERGHHHQHCHVPFSFWLKNSLTGTNKGEGGVISPPLSPLVCMFAGGGGRNVDL